MARRINLVYNPTFRIVDGLGKPDGWESVFSTISKSTTYALNGDHSLQVVKTANPQSGARTSTPIYVTPGLSYASSAYVRVPTDNDNASLVISVHWFNDAGVELSASNISSDVKVLTSFEGWYRLYVIGTAPLTASYMRLYVVQTTQGVSGEEFHVDSVMVEQSSFVGNYVDNFTQDEETLITNRALTPVQLPTIGGMELNADVILGDLVFNTIDENSVVWVCTDIDGWWGHPDAEVPDINRGTQDGSYQVEGRYAARQLTLSGVFLPKTSADIGAARDRLIAATNLARAGAWLKTSETPTKASFVRLAGRPQIQTVNARGRTEFSIPLRAADPIKYKWNDQDLDGITDVTIAGTSSVAGDASNEGTATVAPKFEITGPLGTNSTIVNTRTGTNITIVSPLRGARRVAAVKTAQIYNGIVTLTTIEKHNLVVGDIIDVTGAGVEFDSSTDVPFTVTAVTTTAPFSVSYATTQDDITEKSKLGAYIKLRNNDVILIDSYERSVTLNGDSSGHRGMLDTLIDWVDLVPGDNPIDFTDNIDPSYVTHKTYNPLTNVATLTTSTAHFLEPLEDIVVTLDSDALLKRKSLASQVATLTTTAPHGFSVGDLVDVEITVSAAVAKKEVATAVGYLTIEPIEDVDAFANGDIINVALPTNATVAYKARVADVSTITTQAQHGFSNGDSVTVTLPVNSSIFQKSVTSNVVELATTSAHGYSVGDTVAVTLPTSATVTSKVISGSTVTMTTSAAHGFSNLDVVAVALPTSAVMSGTRTFAGMVGDYLVTLNTSSAHNYNVGDIISVNLDIPSTASVTFREADASSCTLTLSNTHNYSVGEQITVTNVGTRYNGTFVISSVNVGNKTVTYLKSGAVETSTAVSPVGTVVNNTIATGYNGTKVVNSVPTSTSLTYFYYGQDEATNSTLFGGSKTLTNTTNTQLNGSYPVTIVSTTKFSYTKAGA